MGGRKYGFKVLACYLTFICPLLTVIYQEQLSLGAWGFARLNLWSHCDILNGGRTWNASTDLNAKTDSHWNMYFVTKIVWSSIYDYPLLYAEIELKIILQCMV